MDCVICNERAAVGACIECGTKVCGQCGKGCQYCGRGVCPEHRTVLPSGRAVCPSCLRSHASDIAVMQKNATASAVPEAAQVSPSTQVAAAHSPAPDALHPQPINFEHAEEAEGVTSFSDLMADLDDIADHKSTDQVATTVAEPPSPTSDTPEFEKEDDPDDYVPDMTEQLRAKIAENDTIKMEAMTGSIAEATPRWVTALKLGGAATVAVIPIATSSGFLMFQPWLSYIITLVGLFAMIYAISGLRRKQDPPEIRKRCLAGFALGLFSIVLALLYRSPYLPGDAF